MKNTVLRFVHAINSAVPMGDCFGTEQMLAHEYAKESQVNALIIAGAGSLALEGGNFTVDPTVAVPEASLVERRLVEENIPSIRILFGKWEDTTQEPPVSTPAQLSSNAKPEGVVGWLAKCTRTSEVRVKALQ